MVSHSTTDSLAHRHSTTEMPIKTHVFVLNLEHFNVFDFVAFFNEDLLARVVDLAVVPHFDLVYCLVLELFDQVLAYVQNWRVEGGLVDGYGLVFVAEKDWHRVIRVSCRGCTDGDAGECSKA